MANPRQIIRFLNVRGVDLRLDHDQLIGTGRLGPIPDDVAEVIRANRASLIAYLVQERQSDVVPDLVSECDPAGDEDPDVLVGRLNTGWTVCDQEPDPAKRARLEDHWITLLRRYEEIVDRQHQTVTPWMASDPMEETAA